MPDYSKGKIYTIRCRSDDTLIYVGSTINPLSKRWGDHKSRGTNINGKSYNLYVYETIRNNCGFINWYIELYENFICENKDELRKREGEIIRMIGNLNSQIAGRTKKEYREENKEENKEYQKIHYEEHKEEIKIHYRENKEEILEKAKIHYEEHKEEIKERCKIHYGENKEEINEKRKLKYTCICGTTLRIDGKLRHEKSIKHTKFINL